MSDRGGASSLNTKKLSAAAVFWVLYFFLYSVPEHVKSERRLV